MVLYENSTEAVSFQRSQRKIRATVAKVRLSLQDCTHHHALLECEWVSASHLLRGECSGIKVPDLWFLATLQLLKSNVFLFLSPPLATHHQNYKR